MMKIQIFSVQKDMVIDAHVALGETDYLTAISDLYPLINKFDSQRKTQDQKFYEKLKRDLVDGCVIPPITIAFIVKPTSGKYSVDALSKYVNSNIKNAFILDGIQRLNTIYNASQTNKFESSRRVYVNVIVCESEDKLLYRMITLNNGQRPMTPRHQVEVMMNNALKIDLKHIAAQTEKDRGEKIIRGAFKYGDIVQAYLAFITNSTNIDNKKIIDEKMDQLLVGKILDNEPKNYKIKFNDVLNLVESFCKSPESKAWFKQPNNLIGFCVASLKGYPQLSKLTSKSFLESKNLFEESFEGLDKSKIKLGSVRKRMVKAFYERLNHFSNLSSLEILEEFASMLDE